MRKPRRHTPSTIDRLDPEIRDLIGKLRIDKGYTIDEIRAQLEKMLAADLLPSRSALGRHVKSIEEVGAQLRVARETAQALISQVGEGNEDRLVELNIELLQSSVLRLLTATNDDGDGQPVTLAPMEAMLTSKTIQQLVAARKANTEMIVKARQEVAKAAAKMVEAVARDNPAGWSKATVEETKRRIMGIAV